MDELGRICYFISFRYLDDEPDKWVTEFRKHLHTEFGLRTGWTPESQFYCDYSKDNTAEGSIEGFIRTGIAHADLFIAFVSNAVLKSSYCKDERHAFKRVCEEKGWNFANRTFLVRLDEARAPDILRDLRKKYEFYVGQGVDARRICHPTPKDGHREWVDYRALVNSVAGRMHQALAAEDETPRAAQLSPDPRPANKPIVQTVKDNRQIYIDGVGRDGKFAKDTADKLRSRGFPHAYSNPEEGDPNVGFANYVDDSDVVVILRKHSQKQRVQSRHEDARKRFIAGRKPKELKNVLLIDAAPGSRMPENTEERVIDARGNASPSQCAHRIDVEMSNERA